MISFCHEGQKDFQKELVSLYTSYQKRQRSKGIRIPTRTKAISMDITLDEEDRAAYLNG